MVDFYNNNWMFGFAPFEEHALGNGDNFGFYWPVGREGDEPLIIELQHDSFELVPFFSNLNAFRTAVAGLEDHDWYNAHDYRGDLDSPFANVAAAREALARSDLDGATTYLERAIEIFPEYREALALLAGQYRRLKRTDDAARLAVRIVRASMMFGRSGPIDNTLKWFSKLADGPADLADDPLWQGRAMLETISSGGTKDSPAYGVLREAIETYIEREEWAKAIELMETYSQYMLAETRSLQERHGFNAKALRERQKALSDKLPHGPRYFA